jgi:hypothetical protein
MLQVRDKVRAVIGKELGGGMHVALATRSVVAAVAYVEMPFCVALVVPFARRELVLYLPVKVSVNGFVERSRSNAEASRDAGKGLGVQTFPESIVRGTPFPSVILAIEFNAAADIFGDRRPDAAKGPHGRLDIVVHFRYSFPLLSVSLDANAKNERP